MALKNKHKNKFLRVFSITLIISLIIVFCGYFIVNMLFSQPTYDPEKQRDSTLVSEKESKAEDDAKSTGFLTAPVRTNVLILGVDKEENLTDVIMVASFISTTGEINLMSIPRDTYTKFSGDSLQKLREINKGAPSIMKLNAVYSYTGKKAGVEFLQKTIEEMAGINIDYYVKINLDAFKEIVDAIGGVYFTVPEGGLKYSDPTQNLKIDLKEGYQLLDGEAAEGLVRFRKGYTTQDLKRVEVQQEFVKEFIKQVLNKETLMSNLGEVILSLIKYVETDFGISDLPKYITSIQKINVNNLNSATAPGDSQYIDGASYYLLNTISLKEIVDDYFYGNTDPEEINQETNEEIEQETSTMEE
ncbi:MAG: LCP family protein [Eubacteriales bacterium]|nr:LCP family protein [Eubacteriales bacterium]